MQLNVYLLIKTDSFDVPFIIAFAAGGKHSHTIWHGMTEPKIDAEELQR